MSIIKRKLLDVAKKLEDFGLDKYTPILLTWREKCELGELVNSAEFQELESQGSIHQALYAESEGVVGESDKKLLALKALVQFINDENEEIEVKCWARYFSQSLNYFVYCNLPELFMIHIDLFGKKWDFRNQLIGCTEETISDMYNLNWAEPSFKGGSICNNGLSRNIVEASNGWWWSVQEKRWTRGINHGYRPRGKSLSDKRRAEMRDLKHRSRAVWV